jgi:hypothetical protein
VEIECTRGHAQFMHVTGVFCVSCLEKSNIQVIYFYMKLIMNKVLKDFLKKRAHDQLKLTYCSWMNRNQKPSNKAKIFY